MAKYVTLFDECGKIEANDSYTLDLVFASIALAGSGLRVPVLLAGVGARGSQHPELPGALEHALDLIPLAVLRAPVVAQQALVPSPVTQMCA